MRRWPALPHARRVLMIHPDAMAKLDELERESAQMEQLARA